MSSWSARNLTLLGKIAKLKSLVVSQIVYLLSSLPSPPGVIKEINCLLHDFLLVRSLSAKKGPDRYRSDKSTKFGTELL